MAYLNETRTTWSGIADRVVHSFAEFRASRARARIYRATLSELGALTDRELADLGLSRMRITSVAYEAAYGK